MNDEFPTDQTPPFGQPRSKPFWEYTAEEIEAMPPEKYDAIFPKSFSQFFESPVVNTQLEEPLKPGRVIRVDHPMPVISEALHECLKDPDFLRRLDGAILQVREFEQWRFSESYHEDSDWRHYLAESMKELVLGRGIWARMKVFDEDREVADLERKLREKKRRL